MCAYLCVCVCAGVSSAVSLPPRSGFTAVGLAGRPATENGAVKGRLSDAPASPGFREAVWSADAVAGQIAKKQKKPNQSSHPLLCAHGRFLLKAPVQPHRRAFPEKRRKLAAGRLEDDELRLRVTVILGEGGLAQGRLVGI